MFTMVNSNCRRSLLVVLSLLTLGHSGGATPQKNTRTKENVQTARDRQAQREQEAQLQAAATSNSKLALPFKRAWVYISDSVLTLPPSLDGSHIYLPMAGGVVICLDRASGSLL